MGNTFDFDYYYGIEAEQYSFYRVPRLLIKDERFKGLSSDAKLLYGLMLDRMSLSLKNGWMDDENRVYIYYTVENIMEDLGCAKEKCSKILAELSSEKGIGLIEKKRQGLGKPDMIYVMNFATLEADQEVEAAESPCNTELSTEVRKSNFKKSENRTSRGSEIELQEVGKSNFKRFGNRTSRNSEIELQEIRKSNFKKFENQTSRDSEIEPQEVRKSNSNYTNKNHIDMSYNNLINLSDVQRDSASMDGQIDEIKMYVDFIRERIGYAEHMEHDNLPDKRRYEEMFELICDVVCSKADTIRIGNVEYPHEIVKSQFLKLNNHHLEYVLECMNQTTIKIKNIKAYLLAALYNAPMTMNNYYQQAVQHDLHGG